MDTETTRNGTFFRFEDLRVYHKALDYVDWVYTATQDFESHQMHFLRQRFVNSAQAIAFYITEGSARNKSQFIFYLKMAKSSVRECVVTTSLAEKKNLLNEVQIGESRNELMELTKMIGALIGSLQKANSRNKQRYNGRNHDENDDDENQDDYNVHDDNEFVPSDSIDINKY